VSELLAVDSCLDRGGSYDYAAGICDFQKSHAYAPSFRVYLLAALVAVMAGSWLVVSKAKKAVK